MKNLISGSNNSNRNSVPLIKTKEDVDAFLSEEEKHQHTLKRATINYILDQLPQMSRVRAYFVRRLTAHNEHIKELNEQRQKEILAKQEAIREKKRKREIENQRRTENQRLEEERKREELLIQKRKEREQREIEQKELQLRKKRYALANYRAAKAQKELEDNGFDNFKYLYLRSVALELYCAVNPSDITINGSPYNQHLCLETLRDHFHHYYYQRFKHDALCDAINIQTDEKFKTLLHSIADSMDSFIEEKENETYDKLSQIGKEHYLENFKDYFYHWHSEIVRYVDENKYKISRLRLAKDLGIMIASNLDDYDQDYSIEYFITISELINEHLSYNISRELFNEVSKICMSAKYEFPTEYSDILKYADNMKDAKQTKCSIETGIIEVSWQYVSFGEGFLLIHHPNHFKDKAFPPFKKTNNKIRAAFNNISELFIKRLPPIVVTSEKGIITGIVDISDFKSCISWLEKQCSIPDFDICNPTAQSHTFGFAKEQLHKLITKKDPVYLKHLCNLQLDDFQTFYIIENVTNSSMNSYDEEGFLFVVKTTKKYAKLIYENTEPDRATIIFNVLISSLDSAIRFIHEYFSSNLMNKRELISNQQIRAHEHGIVNYSRVNHTTPFEWKIKVNEYLL